MNPITCPITPLIVPPEPIACPILGHKDQVDSWFQDYSIPPLSGPPESYLESTTEIQITPVPKAGLGVSCLPLSSVSDTHLPLLGSVFRCPCPVQEGTTFFLCLLIV